jgi:shikimate kinase
LHRVCWRDISKVNKTERIYLIGFMGSGKSSCGRLLADELQFPFLDLDELIEKEVNQSIPDFFRNNSQTEFRKIERELLKSTASLDKAVIACGGGTPCYFDNIDWMLDHGLVIYLRYPAEILKTRLQGSERLRPVLNAAINEDAISGIDDLLGRREEFYKRAHAAVDGGQSSIAQLLTGLMEIVEKWRKRPSILYT